MSYWKGLIVAAAIDLVWIAGCPLTPSEPDPAPPVLPAPSAVAPAVVETVADLIDIDGKVDSMMMYLQEHPDDVGAMEDLARLYADNDWHDAAIGPLARALQLDPSRRGLWVALDQAVERSGRVKITDAELTRKAQDFVEAVEMWGQGC